MSKKVFKTEVSFDDVARSTSSIEADDNTSKIATTNWIKSQEFFADIAPHVFNSHSKTFTGPVNFTGSVSFAGGTVDFAGANLQMSDFDFSSNFLTVNGGETGNGIDGGLGIGGLLVDRGISTDGPAEWSYDDANDRWQAKVGINFADAKFKNVNADFVYVDDPTPSHPNHATSKQYVDNLVIAASGDIFGSLASGAIDTTSIDLTVDSGIGTWKADLKYDASQFLLSGTGLSIKASWLETLGSTHNHGGYHALVNHSHTISQITDFSHTHTEYALSSHSHGTTYAMAVHAHTEYAPIAHTHPNPFENSFFNVPIGFTQRSQFSRIGNTSIQISAGGAYHLNPHGAVRISADLNFIFGPSGSNTSSSAIVSSTTPYFMYVYLDESEITAKVGSSGNSNIDHQRLLINKTTAPIWNSALGGWYNGSDRCIFATRILNGIITDFFHDGGEFVQYAANIDVYVNASPSPTTWYEIQTQIPIFSKCGQFNVYYEYDGISIRKVLVRKKGSSDSKTVISLWTQDRPTSIFRMHTNDLGQLEIQSEGKTTLSTDGFFLSRGI